MDEFVSLRLLNHHLAGQPFERPEEAVHWFGAVQAQEYHGAKWGLAQRMSPVHDTDLDRALAAGKLLRTHVLRPTWHFVAPGDIRWLLQLTGPRVHAANAYYYRRLGLDSEIFRRSRDLLVKNLSGSRQLTRYELAAVLQTNGLLAQGDDRLRLAYILMHAELDGVICSGAMRGKQHTYALLDERVPPAAPFDRDEALSELCRRYFTSHGPATLKDFSWWSGLSMADVRAGVVMSSSHLVHDRYAEKQYWRSADASAAELHSPLVHLLPAYDEYTVAYKDHSLVLNPQWAAEVTAAMGIVIVIDGQIAGGWKRTFQKDAVAIDLRLFQVLSEDENQALAHVAQRYGEFLEKPVQLNG